MIIVNQFSTFSVILAGCEKSRLHRGVLFWKHFQQWQTNQIYSFQQNIYWFTSRNSTFARHAGRHWNMKGTYVTAPRKPKLHYYQISNVHATFIMHNSDPYLRGRYKFVIDGVVGLQESILKPLGALAVQNAILFHWTLLRNSTNDLMPLSDFTKEHIKPQQILMFTTTVDKLSTTYKAYIAVSTLLASATLYLYGVIHALELFWTPGTKQVWLKVELGIFCN